PAIRVSLALAQAAMRGRARLLAVGDAGGVGRAARIRRIVGATFLRAIAADEQFVAGLRDADVGGAYASTHVVAAHAAGQPAGLADPGAGWRRPLGPAVGVGRRALAAAAQNQAPDQNKPHLGLCYPVPAACSASSTIGCFASSARWS